LRPRNALDRQNSIWSCEKAIKTIIIQRFDIWRGVEKTVHANPEMDGSPVLVCHVYAVLQLGHIWDVLFLRRQVLRIFHHQHNGNPRLAMLLRQQFSRLSEALLWMHPIYDVAADIYSSNFWNIANDTPYWYSRRPENRIWWPWSNRRRWKLFLKFEKRRGPQKPIHQRRKHSERKCCQISTHNVQFSMYILVFHYWSCVLSRPRKQHRNSKFNYDIELAAEMYHLCFDIHFHELLFIQNVLSDEEKPVFPYSK